MKFLQLDKDNNILGTVHADSKDEAFIKCDNFYKRVFTDESIIQYNKWKENNFELTSVEE